MNIKEFYTCPSCGRMIAGEKKRFFVCPKCGAAICEEKKLEECDDRFCHMCGMELTNAKEEALALVKREKSE